MPEIALPTVRYHPSEPSRLIETPEDLAALGPEWQDYPCSDEEKAAWQAQHQPQGAPGTVARIHPEVYRLVLRSCMGQGTADEQVIVAELTAYLMRDALGQATPDETRMIATLLQEFGIPLFVAER